MCGGPVCGSLCGVGVPSSVGLFSAGVCGLAGVGGDEARSAEGSVAGVRGCSGGGGRLLSRGPGRCALVGLCGPLGGEWGGRGRGCGAGFACGVSVYMSACSSALVW